MKCLNDINLLTDSNNNAVTNAKLKLPKKKNQNQNVNTTKCAHTHTHTCIHTYNVALLTVLSCRFAH